MSVPHFRYIRKFQIRVGTDLSFDITQVTQPTAPRSGYDGNRVEPRAERCALWAEIWSNGEKRHSYCKKTPAVYVYLRRWDAELTQTP